MTTINCLEELKKGCGNRIIKRSYGVWICGSNILDEVCLCPYCQGRIDELERANKRFLDAIKKHTMCITYHKIGNTQATCLDVVIKELGLSEGENKQ